MKMATIWFDMDGTIADLYGVEDWLDYIVSGNPYPYMVAKPLVRLNVLARMLNKAQKKGHTIGVISWLAKNSDSEYDMLVTQAKEEWLKRRLKSVKFDEVHIVPYGTPKQIFCKTAEDILFDDEEPNRKGWSGIAYDVDDIIGTLKGLK